MKIFTKTLTNRPKYLQEVLVSETSEIKREQLRVKEYSKKIPKIAGRRTTILPWSGGLDSTTSLLMALESGNRVITVNFNYGQTYWKKEKETISKLSKRILKENSQANENWIEHHEIDISWMNKELKMDFQGDWQHIFPLRNFLILMESMEIARNFYYKEIWFSCVQGEIPFSGGDKSIVFLTEMARILSQQKVLLITPLLTMNKTDIVNWALCDIEGRYNFLKMTISCFSGQEDNHCGACLACFTRLVGFYSADKMADCGFTPIYESLKPFIIKYEEALLQKGHHYSPSREKALRNLIDFLKENQHD